MNMMRMVVVCSVALLAACGKVTTTKPDGGTGGGSGGGTGGGSGGGAGGGSGGGGGNVAVCGDGTKAASEACDDGNKMADDGCSATCTVEAGWSCTGTPKSTCVNLDCGNGKVDASEQCDDGNTRGDDGCSPSCKFEPGWEVEPNDTDATANDFAVVSLNQKVMGNIDPASDLDVFKFVVPPGTTGTFNIVTLDAAGKSCADLEIDTTVTIRDANGTEVNSNTDSGPGYCSKITIKDPAPGTYFLEVSGDPSASPDVFPYALAVAPGVCGDGVVSAAESCDDGNTTGSDGCDSTCNVQSGYVCTGAPSTCTKSCGNGKLDGTENCDDGNTTAGDGCSASCKVESNHLCSGTPSTCTTACAAAPPVTLPTGNTPTTVNGTFAAGNKYQYFNFTLTQAATVSLQALNGTGGACSASTPALDIDLAVYESDCSTNVDSEYATGCPALDLPNLAPGTYTIRAALYLGGSTPSSAVPFQLQLSLITPGCGNARKETGETCDDGNTTPGDGCDAVCATESGWLCTGGSSSASTCTKLVCGDGKTQGTETCDDGNATSGDGCSSTCTKEAGWTCTTYTTPSTCSQLICGDGKAQGTEDCDDGNTNSGDGCSSTCLEEPGFSCTGGFSTPSVCKASCGDGNHDSGESCDDGNTNSGDGCDKTCLREPGYHCTVPYFGNSVCNITCGNGALDPTVGESCDDGNLAAGDGCSPYCTIESPVEVEPNDAIASAQVLTFTNNVAVVLADHPVDDVDLYAVTVPANTTLKIEVMEGDGSETCESNGMDSYLRLLNASGTKLASDEDGRGYCSAIDQTSTTNHAGAANLAAGTYYVEVTQSSSSFTQASSTFKYVLRITK